MDTVRKVLDGGVSWIQYRQKNKDRRTMLLEAEEMRKLTKDCGACLVVNDFCDIALAVDADGVHLGQDDLPSGRRGRSWGQALSAYPPTGSPRPSRLKRAGLITSASAPSSQRRRRMPANRRASMHWSPSALNCVSPSSPSAASKSRTWKPFSGPVVQGSPSRRAFLKVTSRETARTFMSRIARAACAS
ncbi:MAG: thiamine phosphate synthase [Desulfobacterales bacterium]|nr:thiamine phosphate synthase [Desulfobacterales bacterium]